MTNESFERTINPQYLFPLGVRETVSLTSEQAEKLRAIEKYNLDFLLENLTARLKLNAEEANKATYELRRFFGLIALQDSPLGLPQESLVDEAWHEFALFTAQYRKFCDVVFGEFIEHQPRTTQFPVPRSALYNLVEQYNYYYGRMDSIWGPLAD